MNKKPYPIEPALLTIFRLFVVLRVIYSVVIIVFSATVVRINPTYSLFFGLVTFVVVLVYLSSNRLRLYLGRYYLPVALTAVTIPLILERELIDWRLTMRWQEFLAHPEISFIPNAPWITPGVMALENNWPTLLYIPLVLVAWQYGFRSVMIFICTTICTYLFLNFLMYGESGLGLTDVLIVIIGRVLALSVVGYTVTYLSKALREQRNELRTANTQLMNYLTTQEQLAISQERNRLARELHDTLAHTLSATTIQLEATSALWETNPTKAHDLMEQALQKTRAGLTETRRALESLRASPLEDMGLLLSLRQLACDSAERSGYRLELDLPASLLPLPSSTEQTLYRCAQEAFANIARHSAAQLVRVRLAQMDDKVELKITDDGRGFNPVQVDQNQSFGLTGIRERIELLDGQLQITSKPGQGTTIYLSIGTLL